MNCSLCRVTPMQGYLLSMPGVYAPELSSVPKKKVVRVKAGRQESFELKPVAICRGCFDQLRPVEQAKHNRLITARRVIDEQEKKERL